MSTQFTRALPIRVLFFIAAILLEPLSTLGSCVEEEEERRRGRPLTAIQTFTIALRGEVAALEMLYPEGNAVPTALAKITSVLTTYMREQLFTVSNETSGPLSTVSTGAKTWETRHEEYKKAVTSTFPSSLTISEYLERMHSPTFIEAAENSSYVHLLEEWARKLSSSMPYTSFLPEMHLRKGMLVFCLHPQDVPYAREFLSLLYDALTHLRRLQCEALIPNHRGLKAVFKIFEKNHENKEEVLRLWGTPLLDGMEEYYGQELILFRWNIMTQALTAARKNTQTSLQEVKTQFKDILSSFKKTEESSSIPDRNRISKMTKLYRHEENVIWQILTNWRNTVLSTMRSHPRRSTDPAYDITYAQEALDVTLRKAFPIIKEYRQLAMEIDKLEAAFNISQYFSKPEHRGIQFINPFQVKKDLWPLHFKYREFSSVTSSPQINSLYVFLEELLSITNTQTEELVLSPITLVKRLPPLSLVPSSHQVEVVRTYKTEKGLAAGVDAFQHEYDLAQKRFDSFGINIIRSALGIYPIEEEELSSLLAEYKTNPLNREKRKRLTKLATTIMERVSEIIPISEIQQFLFLRDQFKKRDLEPREREDLIALGEKFIEYALNRIDTPEKMALRRLQIESLIRRLKPAEQEALEQLGKTVFEREVELLHPYDRITYLSHQRAITTTRTASNVFKLKHYKAILNLRHVRVNFLLHTMEDEEESKTRPLRQILSDLEAESHRTEATIRELQEKASRKSHEYEELIHKIEEEHSISRNIQMHARNILSLQRTENSVLSLKILEPLLLRALQERLEIPDVAIPQEAEIIFTTGYSQILSSIESILSSVEKKRPSLPAAFSIISGLITSYKRSIEGTRLNPDIVTMLETVPLFLQSAHDYHHRHSKSAESITELVHQSHQPKEINIEPKPRSLKNSGKEAATRLRSMSTLLQLDSSKSSISTETVDDISLLQLAQQLDEAVQAFEALPQKIVSEILSKFGIAVLN